MKNNGPDLSNENLNAVLDFAKKELEQRPSIAGFPSALDYLVVMIPELLELRNKADKSK